MGKSTINGPFSIVMYVYQRVLNTYGMILLQLHPPCPPCPPIQAVLGHPRPQRCAVPHHWVARCRSSGSDLRCLGTSTKEKPHRNFPWDLGTSWNKNAWVSNAGGEMMGYMNIYIYDISGWWYTYPSEKYMTSSVGTIIPNIIFMEQ